MHIPYCCTDVYIREFVLLFDSVNSPFFVLFVIRVRKSRKVVGGIIDRCDIVMVFDMSFHKEQVMSSLYPGPL